MSSPVNTDPRYWFLTDRENRHSDLALFSKRNLVEPLIDGRSYMSRFHSLIDSAQKGDFTLLAGWRLDADQRLLPGEDSSNVASVLTAAYQRGVDLRVMLSGHLGNVNGPVHKYLRERDIQCIRDARHPRFGCSHQKLTILGLNGELHAFCGGIDLATERWDDPSHSSPPHRQFQTFSGGWHDVQCYVRGPACHDLDLTFRERWNDPRRPRMFESAPSSIGLPLPEAPEAGPHNVQVLRTYACNNGYPFAPNGEFTARQACLKAISLARNYIYIEDQYFVSYEIAQALESALSHHPDLRVITLVPQAPDVFVRPFNYHQDLLISRLSQVASGRFGIFHLENISHPQPGPQIYVHSKLMIIDDVWVEIGSMNLNRRSTTHDAEVCVAVVDDTIEEGVCKFARDLRIALWSEHLALAPTDPRLGNPMTALDLWRARSEEKSAPVRTHTAARPRGKLIGWRMIVDPQGTCRREPKIPP